MSARAGSVPADAGDPAAVARSVDSAVEQLGTLDVLVNNAGIGVEGGLLRTPLADWDRVSGRGTCGGISCTRGPRTRIWLAAVAHHPHIAVRRGHLGRAVHRAVLGVEGGGGDAGKDAVGEKLDHPKVMRVYGGEKRSRIYMVMEWCEGRLLRKILDEGRMPQDRAIRIAIEVLDALEYIHANGVVHRDLKPENIMVDADDNIKLIDFGIAGDSGARAA